VIGQEGFQILHTYFVPFQSLGLLKAGLALGDEIQHFGGLDFFLKPGFDNLHSKIELF